jgi:tRNA threonylcarbamoyladenosine biosynthesis protein TsaE
MSTVQTQQIVSASSDATLELAEQIGSNLRGGEVIELVSDLGGGKTTFVRGLAKGMGSIDAVSSPSFTLRNEYKTSQLTLYHFDFYRLNEPGLLGDELAEVLSDDSTVTVIEWADLIKDVLPDKRLTIQIKPTSETERQLTFIYPESLEYLTS